MSGTTISTTLTNGVTLDNSPPLTITSTGAVFAAAGPAIIDQTPAEGGAANHVYNDGQLETTAATYAVDLSTFFARDYLTNAGTITGPDGVAFYGQVLANSGTISAATLGVKLQGGTLINAGLIESGGTAIFQPDIGNFIENSGTIAAASTGVNLQGGIFDNTGTIQAGATAISVADGGVDSFFTLATSGRIAGGTDAIYIQNGILDLNVSKGASFSGYVLDREGNAALSLSGPGGSLDIGTSFIGFTQITFDSAATWSLEGATDDLAAGQTISRFWGGDTLILDGFAATSASYVSGIGLELSNASAAVTLHTNAPLPGESFALTSQHGNSTIAVHGAARSLVSLVSAPQANPITPGAGNYAAAITITAAGTIASGAAPAVYSSTSAHVTNNGSISSAGPDAGYAVRNTAYLYNNGVITGENGVYNSDVITNSGTILASGNYGVQRVDILVNSGLISGGDFGIGGLETGGEIVNSGTIAGGDSAIQGSDLPFSLLVEPGAVFIGNVFGDGPLNLEPGATAGSLNIGSFDGFGQISFAPGAAWTLEGTANQLATGQTITGFSGGDTIVLDSFAATSKVYAGGAELLLGDGASTETLDIIGTLKTSDFTITDNAAGGTDISAGVACFARGTRIATPRGNIAVEKLNIGDLVNTMHGVQPIRWIGRRAYAAPFIARNPDARPIRIRRHAIALNVPSRDLYVSPDHAIAEGGVLIHAHLLQNGISIHQPERDGDVEYFHLEFDRHTVLFAENISTESFIDEGAGNRFQNSHMRPAAAKPQKPCLPRVFEGFHLHNIKSRIALRAGIHAPSTLGKLRGVIDECTPRLIRGWAQNSAAPEHPVTLEIISGGFSRLILANAFRPDLRAAGLGSGCHGFLLTLPNLQQPVSVRRASDGAPLPGIGRKRAA